MSGLRVIYRCLKKVMVLDVTRLLVANVEDLKNGTSSVPCGYNLRRMQAGELDDFVKDNRYGLDRKIVSRLGTEYDDCVAAFQGEQLAGYLWLARHSIESEQNHGGHPSSGVPISFPKHSLFIYNAFTGEAHRGKGLMSRLLEFAASELDGVELEQFVSTTDWTNRPALKAFRKSGFESAGIIWRSLSCGFSITKGPKSASQYGIFVGDKARVISRSPKSSLPSRIMANQPLANHS